MTDSFVTLKTTDTYEAAFYLVNGAQVEEISVRKAREDVVRKRGIKTICTITLSFVPSWAITMWQSGTVYGNITEYTHARTKLKQYIHRTLYPKNSA